MAEKINFEKIYSEIQEAVSELEEGQKSFSESIQIYKRVKRKINQAKQLLQEMEGQIEEIGQDR